MLHGILSQGINTAMETKNHTAPSTTGEEVLQASAQGIVLSDLPHWPLKLLVPPQNPGDKPQLASDPATLSYLLLLNPYILEW